MQNFVPGLTSLHFLSPQSLANAIYSAPLSSFILDFLSYWILSCSISSLSGIRFSRVIHVVINGRVFQVLAHIGMAFEYHLSVLIIFLKIHFICILPAHTYVMNNMYVVSVYDMWMLETRPRFPEIVSNDPNYGENSPAWRIIILKFF